MNFAGCGDISSTTSAARSSANAMATHIDSGLSGETQDDAAQIGTIGDSEEGSGDTGSGAENVSREYKNALRSAESYLKYSDFSKTKLYEQLTSEYGSKYPADAAQYAIDNVKADWKAEALDAICKKPALPGVKCLTSALAPRPVFKAASLSWAGSFFIGRGFQAVSRY